MKWVLVILLIVVGCASEPQLEPAREDIPITEPIDDSLRPDIVRVDVGYDDYEQATPKDAPSRERRSFLDSIADYRVEGLIAGDDRHPLLVGVALGEVLPALQRGDIPLLSFDPLIFRGQSLRMEPLIRFDFGENSTGVLRFEKGDDNVIESELFFLEEKPMFEYAYLLYDGAFPVMEGEEIDFFGFRYVIKEVNEQALVLHGIDHEQSLSLVNGSLLSVNGKKYADTRVFVDAYSVIIQYLAPNINNGGLILRPGEGIREKMVAPLLNPIFDVMYEGLESNPNATLEVESIGSKARLSFFNSLGEYSKIDIAAVKSGELVLGDGDHTYHITECTGFSDFCISVGDEFPVIARDGSTLVFEFRGVNEEGNTLILSDSLGERHIVKVQETGNNESGLPVLDGVFGYRGEPFRMRVLHNESIERDGSRISVDLDSSGSPNGKEVPIILFFDYELEIVNVSEEKISLVLLGNDVRRDIGTERIVIDLVVVGDEVHFDANGNFTLFEDEDDEELYFGMSGIGTFVTLDNVEDGLGEELLIEYPFDYRAGIVKIEG